jgi:HK97 family phage major capsid protein
MAASFGDSMNRSNAANRTALEVPERVIGDIIKDAENTSVALQVGNVHRMSTFQERLRLQNSKPAARWINGTTDAGDAPLGSSNNDDTNQAAKDSGLKQTTSYAYDSLYLRPDELAVLVVMPDAWRDDAALAWEQIRQDLRGAFAEAIDAAVFFGASTTPHPLPSTFGAGIVPSTIAAGNTVDLAAHLAANPTDGTRADRADAYAATAAMIDSKGYRTTNFLVAPGETWNLRRQRDENGAILGADGMFGISVNEVRNGTWDANEAIALTGDFSNLHIGIRQDLTFSLSNSAVITDSAGNVVYNAYQQDGEVLRAVMRLGYVVTNPLKNLTGQREHPFAALVPGSASS